MKWWEYEEIKLPSGHTFRERVLMHRNGGICCSIIILALVVSGIFSFFLFKRGVAEPSLKFILYALYGMLAAVALTVMLCRGAKIVRPNEAAVFTLLGKYYLTIIRPGFYFINPLATEEGVRRKYGAFQLGGIVGSYLNGFGSNAHRIPLSPMICTIRLDNIFNTQKGYVLSMGAKVKYKIKNPTRAIFAVDDFEGYFYETCESVLRADIRKNLCYGEINREKINELVEQLIGEIESTAKINIQEALSPIGCEVLSIALNEVYDKKENQYFTITGE
ncbi:MAG: SPFH domain-containing protein [Eubacteriales bacterium]|nr:SPFH domain-containing protein [Eubacteriales bacterium]